MDLKYFWTKTHTLLGITAGVVLCAVGVTGAMQSFEGELLRILNPEVFKPEGAPGNGLSTGELFERAQAAHPDKRIASWQIYSVPGHPVRIGFAAMADTPGASGAAPELPRQRTEFRYLDSADGALHPPLRGEQFFRTVNDIHRRLAAGDAGKRIVGASVLCLVVLCLSGLYLRWPVNPLNWRAWLKPDFRHTGRRFLRDLHMTVGTWLLMPYLLSALTGLYWSYGWYKDALYALSGTAPPAREMKLETAGQGIALIDELWRIFLHESGGGFREATLRFPESPEHALEIRYLDAEPAHERAYSRLFLHPDTGTVVAHERYAEKSAGAKLMASILPLHTGNFFGLPGILLLMLSGLLMPLFAITGWKMYLDRHRREHRARAGARSRDRGVPESGS
jgi:sulfite reductase (NADPH) flavoprotein alpha-component